MGKICKGLAQSSARGCFDEFNRFDLSVLSVCAQVQLASAGFEENDTLSLKFFLLYGLCEQLCEQQLSKQRRHDFGLRVVLFVLRAAGAVLRSARVTDELFLVMRTIRDKNMSKLVFKDIELLISLLADLFPGLTGNKARFEKLEAGLERVVVDDLGIIRHLPWVAKVTQLHETRMVRRGIMVVGPAGSGKSCCYEALLRTRSEVEWPH